MLEPEPTASGAPHDPEDARKPKVLLAAAIAGLMLLVSLSIAGITAWYLMVGEQGNAVQNTLPSDCEWLIENHEGELFPLLAIAANSPEFAALPHPASAIMAALPELRKGPMKPFSGQTALPLEDGIGICGQRGATLLSIPLGDDVEASIAAVTSLVEQQVGRGRWAVSDPIERFTERTMSRDRRNVASILHTETQAVVVLAGPGQDASKIQTDAVRSNHETSMRTNTAYREGRERVGGTERVWLSGDTVRTLAKGRVTAEQMAYLEHATWLAASLRTDEGDLLVHVHIGGGQRLFNHASRRLKDEGDLSLRHEIVGLQAKYFVVDKGVILAARIPLAQLKATPVVAPNGS